MRHFLILSILICGNAFATDCQTPALVRQIGEYIYCQKAISMGACGALGGFVAGRVGRSRYAKSYATVPAGPRLSEAEKKEFASEYEAINKKVQDLKSKNPEMWQKLFHNDQSEFYKSALVGQIKTPLAGPSNVLVPEVQDFLKKWELRSDFIISSSGIAEKELTAAEVGRVLPRWIPGSATRSGLLLGGLAGAVAFGVGYSFDTTATGCSEEGDPEIPTDKNNNCVPVYTIDSSVVRFLSYDDQTILQKLKNPKVCDFYTKLHSKLFYQPSMSAIHCVSSSNISMKIDSRGKIYDHNFVLSDGKVTKLTWTSGLEKYQADLVADSGDLRTLTDKTRGDVVQVGNDANTQVSPRFADLLRQSKLYMSEVVDGCKGTDEKWKDAFVKPANGVEAPHSDSPASTKAVPDTSL